MSSPRGKSLDNRHQYSTLFIDCMPWDRAACMHALKTAPFSHTPLIISQTAKENWPKAHWCQRDFRHLSGISCCHHLVKYSHMARSRLLDLALMGWSKGVLMQSRVYHISWKLAFPSFLHAFSVILVWFKLFRWQLGCCKVKSVCGSGVGEECL